MVFTHGTSSSYRKCQDGPGSGPCGICVESRRAADAKRQARKRKRDQEPAAETERSGKTARLRDATRPVGARRRASARGATVTQEVTPEVTLSVPSESLLLRGARQAGLLPSHIQRPTQRKSIALPPMPRPAIGTGGKSESHTIQDCVEGNHPWDMTDPETGLAKCSRAPDCPAIRQDTRIREADTLNRFIYHNTSRSDNPRMPRNPSLRGGKTTYLEKPCPLNICSDAPGVKCPHKRRLC